MDELSQSRDTIPTSIMTVSLLITAAILFLYYVYHKITTIFTYWKKKDIKGPKPHPVFGNTKDLIWTRKHNYMTLTNKIYNDYPTEKVVGIYQGTLPSLVVRDPEIMKTILIKDFNHFTDRGITFSKEPLTRNLFVIDGNDWKMLRQKLTPIFTTGKLKGMMPLLNDSVEKYVEYLYSLADGVTPREIKSLIMKYTIKSITSAVIGLDINTFMEETTEIEIMAKKIFQTNSYRAALKYLLNNYWPGIADILRLPVKSDVSEFFLKIVKQVVRERVGKPKVRKDFMDLIIELKEQDKLSSIKDDEIIELEITDELITAQAVAFYAAGFETSSGAMTFLLYELAINNDIQESCYKEIDIVMKKYKGKLDYDALKELEFVSAAFDESLRKYPVVASLVRQAVTDYTFRDINLTIDKGTKIFMPILSLQNDSKYYPNPEIFTVERFTQQNKNVFRGVYMPFGEGPRNCIGTRFARVMVRENSQ